jgi:16S rRNA (cytosine1402-N4)-methyltransferase
VSVISQPTVGHTPVMVDEVLQTLAPQPGEVFVDSTVGAGGHAEAVLEAASPGGLLLGIDADPHALSVARARLAPFGDAAILLEGNFRDIGAICREHGFAPVHGVLFDLGLSSMQLSDEARGFSFQTEAPLDMRFSPQQSLTAADIVNTYPEQELAAVLWRYGQERHSRAIARRIVRERPLSTTLELAGAVQRTVGGGRLRIHPATRTFQALRIAVNGELENLTLALDQRSASWATAGAWSSSAIIPWKTRSSRISCVARRATASAPPIHPSASAATRPPCAPSPVAPSVLTTTRWP